MLGQATSPMSLTRSSTKGVIPHAMANTMKTLKDVEKAINAAVKKYQTKLRKDAVSSWGVEVAKTIKVTFNSDSMVLTINSDHPDAELLEAGDSENPPKPVLRSAAVKAQAELVPLIKEQFQKLGIK
jgi:hypothetical protein